MTLGLWVARWTVGRGANRTNSVPVGQVFFGQFIDHDITLDISSGLGRVNDPHQIGNTRTPTLDLDSIYGLGPEASNFMYVQDMPFKGAKLLTGADEDASNIHRRNDLLRSVNNNAIIGDFRNDENRILSQLQLAFIKIHNMFCDQIHEDEGLEEGKLLEAARRQTVWHYQWAVVTDFLPAMCGDAVVDRILTQGRKHFNRGSFIPVEFSVAAYRFGHSMIPMKIQAQKNKPSFELFGSTYGRGFSPLSNDLAIVDWHELFNTPENRQVQMAEKLDTKMAEDLLKLPFLPKDQNSLATRNLLRGNSFLLPGGEVVAAHMGRPQAEIDTVLTLVRNSTNQAITSGVPLWYYILAEAEVIGRETTPGNFEPGEGLGPVGATIVAETLIGLLEYDESSFLGANRNWQVKSEFDTIGKILSSVNSTDI